MKPYYDQGGITIYQGDCIEQMAELDEASVDAVACDPPYGLEFMGKDWDRLSGQPGYVEKGRITERPDADVPYGRGGGVNSYQAGRPMQDWHELWAREALRVLKPGGHLLAFGGTRTYHRLACAVEDAGFEIRDSLLWLYGSGFPKSLDVSKAIDKVQGAEGEWRQEGRSGVRKRENSTSNFGQTDYGEDGNERHVYEPSSEEGKQWQGWGTALKPSHEPIVVARKPFTGTVAANVLEHGTGALNIDGCRIEAEGKPVRESLGDLPSQGRYGEGLHGSRAVGTTDEGRWPANVVLSEEAGVELDEQTGELTSGANPTRRGSDKFRGTYGDFAGQEECEPARGAESGGASRFFYCAKTSRAERNAGLNGFPTTKSADDGYGSIQQPKLDRVAPRENWEPHKMANHHPTVKPINLMRWLVRLVTPPGGLILDPFLGSGTTGCAAVLEGFDFIGCEREAEYVAIAEARIAFWVEHLGREVGDVLEIAGRSEREAKAHADAGQLDLGAAA